MIFAVAKLRGLFRAKLTAETEFKIIQKIKKNKKF